MGGGDGRTYIKILSNLENILYKNLGATLKNHKGFLISLNKFGPTVLQRTISIL